MLGEIFVYLLMFVATYQTFEIYTLRKKVQSLEDFQDRASKEISLLKLKQQEEPVYNIAIDPNPETPEEHDYILKVVGRKGDN